MPVTDLAGILIHTTPERHTALRNFYVHTLGLVPRSDRPGFVNFEFGAQRLTIALHDRVQGAASDPERVMVNLAVTDIDTLFATLIQHGAPAIREPSRETWGGTVATTADPDGNIVQLMELPVE